LLRWYLNDRVLVVNVCKQIVGKLA